VCEQYGIEKALNEWIFSLFVLSGCGWCSIFLRYELMTDEEARLVRFIASALID